MIWISQKQKILRRGEKDTQKNYTKKFLMTQITMMVLSLTQSQIYWNVKSGGPQEASLTNNASGGDGIPAELFQILKHDVVKVLHSICQQIWKTQQWPQDWKGSGFIPIPEEGNAKECSNYRTIVLISHASKVCSKSFKPELMHLNCGVGEDS